MQTTIEPSLTNEYCSPSSKQDKAKVNKLEVEDKIVFDVTVVLERLRLKVS